MSDYLRHYAAVNAVIQFGFATVSALCKTEKFFDLACLVVYTGLPALSLYESSTRYPRQIVATAAVVTWSIRLGMFMIRRTVTSKPDWRFEPVTKRPILFYPAYMFQGVWAYVYLLPLFVLNNTPTDAPVCGRDWLAAGLWISGFIVEVISDNQKSAFRSKPENKDKFITSGLWSVCRHPNYFGEILMSLGLYTVSTVVQSDSQVVAALALSPLFTSFMFAKVTGVPILEQNALKRWGEDPEYKNYISKVPKIIPFIY